MIKLAIKCNLQKLNGLSFHRLFVPFSKISDSIEFKCDVFPDLDILSDNQLKDYHAVVYQNHLKRLKDTIHLALKLFLILTIFGYYLKRISFTKFTDNIISPIKQSKY